MKLIEGEHFKLLRRVRPKYELFFNSYSIVDLSIPPDGDENTKGIPRSQRVCRFCSGRMPDVKFRSKAHIIPKNIFGINYGISNFECDNCNNKFSLLETHAANYFGLHRTLSSLGNNKIPSFSPKNSVVAKPYNDFGGKKVIQIKDIDKQNIIFDKASGIIRIKYEKEPYVPINIFKLLLKIGLSLIENQDVDKYKLTMDFLMHNKLSSHFQHFAQVMISSLDYTLRKPYCILFERVSDNKNVCKHMVQLYFHNQMWMFFLPLHDSDILDKKYNIDEVLLCPPILIPEADVDGQFNYAVKNFSSSEFVYNEQESATITIAMDEDIKDKLPENFSIDDGIYLSGNPFL